MSAATAWYHPANGPADVAGMFDGLTELYVVDVFLKRSVKLEVGDTEDQILGVIGWSKDDREGLHI